MIKFFENFIEFQKGIFSSQDSKYFILTATKFTLVPITSFLLVFYSIWTIMEVNFSFFVANGFSQASDVFYDQIFMNINDYFIYFSIMAVIIFMFGLFVSYLALRPFDHIEDHIFHLRQNIDQDLDINWMNKNKLIYQVSKIFFKYIQFHAKNGKKPSVKLPYQIEKLKTPPMDKVFLFQYCSVVGIICLSTSTLLFSFVNEVYNEIVVSGLEILPSNKIVAIFLDEQHKIFLNLYITATILSVFTYILISRNIIKAVDGVSFGFARDMIGIIKGHHRIRFNPRTGDPGQEIAQIINEVLDDVFPETQDRDSHKKENDERMDKEFIPQFDKIEELNQTNDVEGTKDFSTLDRSESKVVTMLMRGEAIDSED